MRLRFFKGRPSAAAPAPGVAEGGWVVPRPEPVAAPGRRFNGGSAAGGGLFRGRAAAGPLFQINCPGGGYYPFMAAVRLF